MTSHIYVIIYPSLPFVICRYTARNLPPKMTSQTTNPFNMHASTIETAFTWHISVHTTAVVQKSNVTGSYIIEIHNANSRAVNLFVVTKKNLSLRCLWGLLIVLGDETSIVHSGNVINVKTKPAVTAGRVTSY